MSNRRTVSFSRLLDATPAECFACGREGRVDRWAYREARKAGERLICEECGGGEGEHDRPVIRGPFIFYRDEVFPVTLLPARFDGEEVTPELRDEIAELLDEKIENGV